MKFGQGFTTLYLVFQDSEEQEENTFRGFFEDRKTKRRFKRVFLT